MKTLDDTLSIVNETDVYLQYVKLKLQKHDALELLILESNILQKKINKMIKCIRKDIKNLVINETNGIHFINNHFRYVMVLIIDLKTFVQFSINKSVIIFNISEYYSLFDYLQDTSVNLTEILQYIIAKCLENVSFQECFTT